jgi:histidyl-tRNA synthetase
MEKRIKARALSGYPEWLPEARVVELAWLDAVRKVFESYGYGSIDPRSVEEIDALVSKAEGQDTDKEIYALRRLAGPVAESEPKVALHFDLTVPLARYVAQNYAALVFPFKRYHISRAWRGERPQEGRFREFYQCDIDVLDNDRVSLHFDSELPRIVLEALDRIGVGPVRLHINNRKVLEGYYRGLGVDDPIAVIRVADKLDKLGHPAVRQLMIGTLNLPEPTADALLALAQIKSEGDGFVSSVRALGVSHPLLDQGLDELGRVMGDLADLGDGRVVADLSIARGLDYYTGTVYEGKLTEFPDYPTICSGGRYDDLVGAFLNRKLPGVGMSIGLTRIFAKMMKEGRIPLGPKGPTHVFVARLPWTNPDRVAATAKSFRARGLNVETHYEVGKLDAQLRYASRKGIPYVWFSAGEAGKPDEVKDLRTGQQVAADPATWTPAP